MINVFYVVVFVAWIAWARAGVDGMRDALTVGGLLLAAFAVHNFLDTVWNRKRSRPEGFGPVDDPRLQRKKRTFFTLQRALPVKDEVQSPEPGRDHARQSLVGFGRESYEVE
jgi:hypothetical protein